MMKLRCKAHELAEALKLIRDHRHLWVTARLEANEEGLSVTSLDYERIVSFRVRAKVEERGVVGVNAKQLRTILASASDEVEMNFAPTVENAGRLEVRFNDGQSVYRLPATIPDDDLTMIDLSRAEARIGFTPEHSKAFLKTLKELNTFRDLSTYGYDGYFYIQPTEDSVQIAATSGAIAAIAKVSAEIYSHEPFLIPPAFTELNSLDSVSTINNETSIMVVAVIGDGFCAASAPRADNMVQKRLSALNRFINMNAVAAIKPSVEFLYGFRKLLSYAYASEKANKDRLKVRFNFRDAAVKTVEWATGEQISSVPISVAFNSELNVVSFDSLLLRRIFSFMPAPEAIEFIRISEIAAIRCRWQENYCFLAALKDGGEADEV